MGWKGSARRGRGTASTSCSVTSALRGQGPTLPVVRGDLTERHRRAARPLPQPRRPRRRPPPLILFPHQRDPVVADCVFFPCLRRTRGCPNCRAAMSSTAPGLDAWLLVPHGTCPLWSPRHAPKALLL